MNSLVKDLCKKCENSICENHRGCAFRSLTNDYCEVVEKVDTYINQLQQENQQLKEQLENTNNSHIFIDTDIEERYGNELYIDYLKQQLKQRDEVIDEAIKYINYHRDYQDVHKQIGINEFEDTTEDILFEKDIDELLKILQRYKGDK